LTAFEALPEHVLSDLDDEALVRYIRDARAAGRHDAMKPAVGILVFGYHDTLVNRALLKLPSSQDAEDVAGEAIASALVSAFDGSSVGEFKSWLHTILSRRVADYWETKRRRPKTDKLPSEHAGDEDTWGREPSVEFEGDAVHARQCVNRAYAELEDARHRLAVDSYVFGAHTAAETAALVGDGMTEANVHQIASRFQARVKELL
jgi:RNA polymerase sigma factor (sigma-70 family)